MTEIKNPFTVGDPVPDCIEVGFYYSPRIFSDIDYFEYIQRERAVPDEAESNRLFELYKKYLHEQQPKH